MKENIGVTIALILYGITTIFISIEISEKDNEKDWKKVRWRKKNNYTVKIYNSKLGLKTYCKPDDLNNCVDFDGFRREVK